MEYTELTPEEAIAVKADMQAVMEKHNCDMQVTSQIQILKRVEAPTLEPLLDESREPTETETTEKAD